jgi:hypothetical protein
MDSDRRMFYFCDKLRRFLLVLRRGFSTAPVILISAAVCYFMASSCPNSLLCLHSGSSWSNYVGYC